MSFIVQHIVPMAITVISGVIVYLMGQYFHIIWLMPLQNYKLIRADIARQLLFYSNVYSAVIKYNEKSKQTENEYIHASSELRKLAANLEAYIQTLYWFRFGIPSKKKLHTVVSSLLHISNSCFGNNPLKQSDTNHNEAEKIRKLLKIY